MPDFIDDLLRRMSLVEKVGQLNLVNPDIDSTGAAAAATDIESRIRRGEIGSLAGGAGRKRLAD
jgi:beta-glucosidase